MSAQAIVRGLIRLAKQLGRWLLERLRSMRVERLLGYMEGKIGDFRRRMGRARTPRRVRRLSRRITRWRAAAAWIEKHSKLVTEAAVLAADETAKRLKIPMQSAKEREA